jgi:hypothetical protein
MHVVIAALVGLAVGVFAPSVARKIHAVLSAEAKEAGGYISAELGKVEADVKADAAKVEKKL